MLPSLGFQEILLLGVLALVVVGPKDLPLLLRKVGRWTAKLRAMAQEFRTGFDELARQAELDELKKEVDALRRGQSDFHAEITKPLNDLSYEVTKPIEADAPPPHDITHSSQPPLEPEPLPPTDGVAAELPVEAPPISVVDESPQIARTAP